MNEQSMCRELMSNGHRCGMRWGHFGSHQCCSLHGNQGGVR